MKKQKFNAKRHVIFHISPSNHQTSLEFALTFESPKHWWWYHLLQTSQHIMSEPSAGTVRPWSPLSVDLWLYVSFPQMHHFLFDWAHSSSWLFLIVRLPWVVASCPQFEVGVCGLTFSRSRRPMAFLLVSMTRESAQVIWLYSLLGFRSETRAFGGSIGTGCMAWLILLNWIILTILLFTQR